MAKITVCIHAVAIMIFMGNVNAVCSDHNNGFSRTPILSQEDDKKSPSSQSIVLLNEAKKMMGDGMKIVPYILRDQDSAQQYLQDVALFGLSALLFPVSLPLSGVVAAIPLVKQLSIQPHSHSYPPHPPQSTFSPLYRGDNENEVDGDSNSSYPPQNDPKKKEDVKLKDYPWVPTISAAVTVAIGTLLVKRIFGQKEKEKEKKESIVSEDVDGEEYNS